MNRKLKITVIAYDDLINGPSLAQFRFAKSLSKLGYNVELLIAFRFFKNDLSRFNDEKIKILNLNKKRTIFLIFPLIKYLLKNKPDVIFSAGDHINLTLLFSSIVSFSKSKLSLSSRVSPLDAYLNQDKIDFNHNAKRKSTTMYYLFKMLNWRADVLTCVSKDMVNDYQKVFGSTKHVPVYNIIKDDDSEKLQNEKITDKWFLNNKSPIIIAAGQMAVWKGFDDLINAYSLIQDKIPHKMVILGDGNDRQKLKNLVNKKKLNEKIYMPGYVINPLKYFKNSEIFVLSSLREGMPNVLLEAMMCGCTPVSTDCKTGPSEIIRNNTFGYLCPIKNPNLLAQNILKAIENPIPKNQLDKVLKEFESEVIIKKHFDLLNI
jgi:glycosyltransferase involved in cell wall biosynthesis